LSTNPPIDADDGDDAAVAHAANRLAQGDGTIRFEHHHLLGAIVGVAGSVPVGLGADGVDARVGPATAGERRQRDGDVLLFVVDRVGRARLGERHV
jgi:hypothetical protein